MIVSDYKTSFFFRNGHVQLVEFTKLAAAVAVGMDGPLTQVVLEMEIENLVKT
jgi:hypothetical protein